MCIAVLRGRGALGRWVVSIRVCVRHAGWNAGYVSQKDEYRLCRPQSMTYGGSLRKSRGWELPTCSEAGLAKDKQTSSPNSVHVVKNGIPSLLSLTTTTAV